MRRLVLYTCFVVIHLFVLHHRAIAYPLFGTFFPSNDEAVEVVAKGDESSSRTITKADVEKKEEEELPLEDKHEESSAFDHQKEQLQRDVTRKASSVGGLSALWRNSLNGVANVINTGQNLAQKTLNGIRHLNDKSFESASYIVDKSTNVTLNKVDEYAKKLDMYKTLFSGITKKRKSSKGHKISIMTESDAPMNAINNFVNTLPVGSGDNTPELDIDFSQFF